MDSYSCYNNDDDWSHHAQWINDALHNNEIDTEKLTSHIEDSCDRNSRSYIGLLSEGRSLYDDCAADFKTNGQAPYIVYLSNKSENPFSH